MNVKIPGFEELDIAWVDLVGLILIGAFLILGLWRGLWWQVMRLVGVVGSIAVARALTPRFLPSVKETFGELSDGVAQGIVWFTLFIAGLLVASLLGALGKRALDGLQLSLADRFGGAIAGALTGANLHGAFLVALMTFGTQGWTSRQLEGTGSERLLDAVVRAAPLLLDAEAADRLLEPLDGYGEAHGGREDAPAPSGSEASGEPLDFH